ncbi:MAG: lytic transglycosylase domain-containing protein [Proteobacteria bacterium]|nr:lytic transglycosylase domain-containing protein [Pseudomonadota bacterium]HQR05087.1 transglycosylase SLT domain-containing protein [Rhodocyclaceae bacterium]
MSHYTTKPRFPLRSILLLLSLLIAPPLSVAAEGDDAFLAAREAFRVGEAPRLARLSGALANHVLKPWVDYWDLSLRMKDDEPGVRAFLAREKGSYLAEKLRGDWLRLLGRQGRWSTFEEEFPGLIQPDQELTCYAWQSRLARSQDRSVLDEARAAWFATGDLPDACTPLMDRLVSERRLSADDVWDRVRRLLDAGKPKAAIAAAAYLPDRQIPGLRTLEAIAKKPARHLDKLPAHFDSSRLEHELALYAITLLGRQDPQDGAVHLRRIESRLSGDEQAYAWGQLALLAAKRHMASASDWFDLAQEARLSDDQMAWRVRAALRGRDWPRVRKAVEQMPARLASQPGWTYWQARALAAQGKREDAQRLYQRIATLPSFYGNLADDELGRPITVPPRAAPPTTDELAQIAALPGVQRALALFRLDLRTEGVREWNWTLRGMPDRQLLAAAEIARRNDIYDRAIYAAERTVTQHDFELRYLAPFRDQVSPQAQELALDDGWVYGLMRQESRFITAAKSGVGAKGLMQLMPATAKWVARKIGLTDYHPGKVADTDTNVKLGTSYLKMVLDRLDNQPVLACAAYNAGPGRAQRWRADVPLEGAIYAETIPFGETRDYVKKVMSNSVYYATLFQNKPQSLKARLGVIPPRGGAIVTDELP